MVGGDKLDEDINDGLAAYIADDTKDRRNQVFRNDWIRIERYLAHRIVAQRIEVQIQNTHYPALLLETFLGNCSVFHALLLSVFGFLLNIGKCGPSCRREQS